MASNFDNNNSIRCGDPADKLRQVRRRYRHCGQQSIPVQRGLPGRTRGELSSVARRREGGYGARSARENYISNAILCAVALDSRYLDLMFFQESDFRAWYSWAIHPFPVRANPYWLGRFARSDLPRGYSKLGLEEACG